MTKGRQLSELGLRIEQACREAGIAPTAAEKKAGFAQGNLNKIMHGESGNQTVNVVRMAALADLLGVSFEWLVIGRGPKRLDLSEGQRKALLAYLAAEAEQAEARAKALLEAGAVGTRRKPPGDVQKKK